jgi:cytochrome c biogenesis protein ResB
MWIALFAIGLLMGLSVLGAFYGAEKAKWFFNSMPLRICWAVIVVLLVAGFVEFPRLLRRGGLMMIHLGCLCVLGGAMWGSQVGHHFAEKFFGIDKIPEGYMVIYEGGSQSSVISQDFREELGQLPFSIKLNDFRIEHYQPKEDASPQLYVKTRQGKIFQLAAEAGDKFSLGADIGMLEVLKTFTDFKIKIEGGQKVASEGDKKGENPAVLVRIDTPDGSSHERYVFERFADFDNADDGLQLRYVFREPAMVRDYFSDIVVVDDGKEVASKTIEVNKPLRYGGYHFYQHSYDLQDQQYTILSVTSDSGLYVVYCGYWLLMAGILWQLWLRHIIKHVKRRQVRPNYNGN